MKMIQEISKSSFKEMHSDSKNKSVDNKLKMNKSSIDFLKKSNLVSSYLSKRRGNHRRASKLSKTVGDHGMKFKKTVQTVIDIMKEDKDKESSKYQKGGND